MNSSMSNTNVRTGGTSLARTVRFVFWSLVWIVAGYVTLLLTLSANGVHIIKGI
jgi:hypothetical protein